MEKLHPGAKWLFRLRGYAGAFVLLIFLAWFIIPLSIALAEVLIKSLAVAILIGIGIFLIFVAAIIILSEVYARMAYNRWFYEFTPSNLKVERGVIWKRYSNVPYERVQNVDIHRGIFARILGFSTVDIQTAGFHVSSGRGGMPRSEGHLPAVAPEKAEKIRDFLMKKISSRGRSQGL